MRLSTLILLLVPASTALALEPIPDKLVVLTFDDASKSHIKVAAPLLKKHGFGATFFVTEGFDMPTNPRDYMTWDEIAQLHRDGFEIGNHTRNHKAPSARDPKGTREQLEAINVRCEAHGIPRPVSFAYPGNALDRDVLPILQKLGIRFARRGGAPEYPYDKGQGFAYEPGLDHPLLIPSAGDARPGWTLEDFKRAVGQARAGKIAVVQLHGVPDTAHPWVNTPTPLFESYVRYLAENGYRVVALRDLARYVDPTVVPANPWRVIEDRKQLLAAGHDVASGRANASKPLSVAERPNILWVVCEDSNVNWFGCYGNAQAQTPNIDALARSGFRYTHAYACAPVCAPSRSTWITGIHAVSTGTQPMRSRYPIPHSMIPYYPDQLRKAGYYTANHTKTDYNIGGRPDGACWDSNKPNAWDLCKPGQPFFQIMNFTSSHESSAHGDVAHTTHSPQDVTLARYHPDVPAIRQNYAKYYDAVSRMDAEVGKTLEALEKAGHADDTIVIFNSDHGGVMPRSKRFLYDSGVHAPLIIRIPEKYQHLWPAKAPGTIVDRPVSFVDMPKTWLSLAGAQVPEIMQGRIFLGSNVEPEPPYVFSFRERMDERIDNQRAVRNKRFAYIKNYMPFVPNGQHLHYLWLMAATRAWEDAYKQHRTDDVTGRFFGPKPVEELYDMDADPDNVVNLAGKPEHQHTLETMRAQLRDWQLNVHDSGLMPEVERVRRASEHKTTIYEMVRDPKLYDLPAYLDAADRALAKDSSNAPQFVTALKHPDSVIRYWSAVGLLMLGKPDATTVAALEGVLNDSCGEVRILSAWALLRSGDPEKAQQTFAAMLRDQAPTTLMVLNALDWSHADLAPYIDLMKALPKTGRVLAEYEQRMVENLLEAHREATTTATKGPVKVFILAGQSNMQGQAVADLDGKHYNDGKGTLVDLLRRPELASRFKHLRDDQGRWTVRDDVWVRYQPEDQPLKAGPLTLGFTAYGDRHHFGPELQFGHVMGDALPNQVLLIKTAWGGKSLYRDFRPPSSGGAVGPYYTKMIQEVRQALANLATDFPGYDGSGYELAGFVWYHGWNDGVDPRNAIPEYEQNLVNLIKDVRHDLEAPTLPVVIGELTGPWVDAPKEWATLRRAQANAARRPEFQGSVLFVETHDFVRKPEDSPNPTHGHHEFGNAETYLLVGDALGKGMKTLIEAKRGLK